MNDTPTVLRSNDGAVATLTLSRPEALNALTPAMLDELDIELRHVGRDPQVRVVVLTGAGRAFSAGVDLKALGGRSLAGGSVGDVLDVPARRSIEVLTTMPKVVVAKLNGFCFTGALELALACDLVVAADEARFRDTHAKFGLRPTWGMSQRLIRLVGVARARELSYTARTFTGVEAAEWGLADKTATTFFRYWTAKEAVLKAAGIGLKDLAKCRIIRILNDHHLDLDYGGQKWKVEHRFFNGHIASVIKNGFEIDWTIRQHLFQE